MAFDIVEKELAKRPPSIIALVDYIIERAVARRASDIHFEPVVEGLRTRLRIDGVLEDAHLLPLSVRDEVVARLKVRAGLRTDEHHAAQDGRFRHGSTGRIEVDVRVSIAPTYHGENAVLRLLAENAGNHTLETLGFTEANREKITDALKRASGMILATGPTGSGKTTTLYTLIQSLNSRERSIVTIEDPIEYAIEGVRHMQVHARAGLTFATGLRTILRQDPDVIMVGEIRDIETAGIAVNTALSGHLLLSSLHTSDAPTTLPRLLDMKIEAFLVASTISLVIGQRLVRMVCAHCKEKVLMDGEIFFQGKGCADCGGSGYTGRIGIHEVLVATDELRAAILERKAARDLRRIAIAQGMRTLHEDGLEKARSGITSRAEVFRIAHE